MSSIVGVRINKGAWVERCDPQDLALRSGEQVIVRNHRGLWLGEVLYRLRVNDEGSSPAKAKLSPVIRRATPEDLVKGRDCGRLEREAHRFCQERVAVRKLAMNLTKVERCLEGSKMVFYFTAEGRIDFRELVKDLAGRFRCRVEMRQVGVRNETKILGGIGGCGRELCCCTFMREFSPVSVKMAKEQNLSLNPNKISGLCGRLMCCLSYEFPVYKECKKNMPKIGRRVISPDGTGKVVRQNVMAGRVTVNVEGKEHEYPVHRVSPAPPPQQPKKQRKPNRRGRKGGQG